MVRPSSPLLWAAILLAACGQSINPCPSGFREDRQRDRCVPSRTANASPATIEDDTSAPIEEDAGSEGMEAETGTLPEGAQPLDGATETGVDADAADPPDAPTTTDAQRDDSEAGAEGGVDAAQDGSAGSCSADDLAAWRNAHLVKDMRVTIHNCRVSCDGAYDCADTCLRQSAGIRGCADCTRAQTECAGPWCSYACLASRTDRICLACLCQTDCVDRFSSCAGADLGVCDPSLYGPETPVETPALGAPALLLGKTLSGALLSSRFDAATGVAGADATIPSFPSGEMQLVTWSIGGRQLAFHYSVSCHSPPCTVRAYPVLDDGSFGTPLYAERWEAGLEDLEVFAASGGSYLAGLRQLEDVSSPLRDLWLTRLEWSSEQGRPVRSLDLRLPLKAAGARAYTLLEPFAIGTTTFLFLSAPATGEVRVLRVAASELGVELLEAGSLPNWSLGWDRVEAFKSAGTWYLLAYKSGEVPVSDEPASEARIFRPSLDQEGNVSLGAPLFEGRLAAELTHLRSYVGGQGLAHLILHSGSTGRTDVHPITADPSGWTDALAQPAFSKQRGRVSPWNVLEIVRSRKWEE